MNTNRGILNIMLVIAACFAIGSIGFFLAVLLQHSAQPAVLSTPQAGPTEAQKNAIVATLNPSEGSSTAATGTSTPVQVLPSQADPNDVNAAAKLKILESLNSQ